MAEEKNKLWAVVAYFFGIIGGILVYLIKKDDPYVKFHAVQSILFNIAYFVVAVIVSVVTLGFGGLIIGPLGILIWLFLMWKAWQGERYMLPLVGSYADQWAK